ncbi:hypothetical protein LTR09_011733 [Extremus antarcticus]|uniref:Uncharacterized protein n=1 Tax=Extremus antarcticus TaxID=702011 RepID=A0AAJ0D5T5_9PEZI|nr:hypothetical protein LTR09_011733 [Extremus antarcticus]
MLPSNSGDQAQTQAKVDFANSRLGIWLANCHESNRSDQSAGPKAVSPDLHLPAPTPTPIPKVVVVPVLEINQECALYCISVEESAAARIIAGRVCNEGLAAPSEQLLCALHFSRNSVESEKDLIAALLMASEYIVDNCQQILKAEPDAWKATRWVEYWKPFADAPFQKHIGAKIPMLADLLCNCLETAYSVSWWQHNLKAGRVVKEFWLEVPQSRADSEIVLPSSVEAMP